MIDFDFGYALRQLRGGLAVRRSGWNGKGMWIALAATGARLLSTPGGAQTLPFIFMRTVQGDFVPWLASQTDILAGDWEVCPL